MYVERDLNAPNQNYFLFGPRGAGKSLWLKHVQAGAHLVNLLEESTYQRLLADPALFAAELRGLERGRWVVVDEIQRLPNLLNEVHLAIEEQGLRFVLCGSSARKLKRAGVNMLGGRATRRIMHPFTPDELGDLFRLSDALRHGLMPVVWDSEDRDETLFAYTQLYLKEEVQAEALVRNLPGFARFLPVAALCHGQTLSVANIARDAGVARTTVTGYLEILEETLLCFRLPGYEAGLRVRERKAPKWYWCDPGVVRAMKGASGHVTPEESGALFEGLIAQAIRAHRDYDAMCDEMYYWGPIGSSDTEIDFLLRKGSDFLAIEAKAGSRFNSSWCKGLRAMASLDGLKRRLVVYPEGPTLRTDDGIDVLPFARFAEMLASGLIWSQGA